MPNLLVQHRMFHDSGLAEDAMINTFCMNVGAITDATTLAVAQKIHSFYNEPFGTQADRIIAYLSSQLTGFAEVRMYDLAQPEPRVPVRVEPLQYFSQGTTALPSEVALCLSFQATPTSGTVPARRRGRVYIGPLGHAALTSAQDPRPNADAIDALRLAALRLANPPVPDNIVWQIWSRANPGTPTRPPYAESFSVVDRGWIDNAFDTQRRRGEVATSRVLWDAFA